MGLSGRNLANKGLTIGIALGSLLGERDHTYTRDIEDCWFLALRPL
jgi:hypothetical protein